MKIFHISLFLISIFIYCKCSTSTSSNEINNKSVTMTTDSERYNRIYSDISVVAQIQNNTDTTIVFPACGEIETRIDKKVNNNWIKGFPRWDSPCLAIFAWSVSVESDSSVLVYINFDTTGVFRIVTYYNSVNETITDSIISDTLYSNEFEIE